MSENNSLTVYQPLTPSVWAMIEAIAEAARESRKMGVSTVGEAAIKFLFCYENGLPMSAANTGLYIVNGRIVAQGNIIAAQLRRHPSYDYKIKAIDDHGCTVQILRKSEDGEWAVEGEASFGEADAKRAKLANKDNYQGYPSDMYFNRALARAQRRFAPDVFSQTVYTPDEMGMKTNEEGDVIEGTWAEVSAPVTPEPEPEPAPALTLEWLTERYGADRIVTASNGNIPETPSAIATLAVALAAEESDDETDIEI